MKIIKVIYAMSKHNENKFVFYTKVFAGIESHV